MRRSLLVALPLALSAAAWPTPATAGSYEVVSCSDGADNAWEAVADPGLAAYDECPSNPDVGSSGIATRASIGGGKVGFLKGAYQSFSAPPGASLDQVSFNGALMRSNGTWSIGMVAYDDDFGSGQRVWGCFAGEPGCVNNPPQYLGPRTIPLYGHRRVRIETRCGDQDGCSIASTGKPPYYQAGVAISHVRVRVVDSTEPEVSPGGDLWTDTWHRGLKSVTIDARDNVGIRASRVIADGTVRAERPFECDYSRTAPCPVVPADLDIATQALEDGTHDLTLEAADAAGNVARRSRQIRVDNTSPPRVDPVVDGGEAWRQQNGFGLSWTDPPRQVAPIVGARYALCPGDDPNCPQFQESRRQATSQGSDVRVPRPGDFVLRLWLEDAAGNHDPASASAPIHLRFDPDPPQVAFAGVDPNDPTQVIVDASDRMSGVAQGTVEIRPRGSNAWRELDTTVRRDHLMARIPDASLHRGTYELRARAADRAGNERTTDRRRDGAEAVIALPLRRPPRMRVGFVQRGRRRVRLMRSRRASRGRRVPIRGVLVDAHRRPIANAPVVLLGRLARRGEPLRVIASARTSPRGAFAFSARADASQALHVRYEGANLVRSTERVLQLDVPATSTLRASRRIVLNGGTVNFTGRLPRVPFSPEGRFVELQAHFRNRWRTFATVRAGALGHWSYAYQFQATRGLVTYRFRARVPQQVGYPFADGASRVVRVRVRGV